MSEISIKATRRTLSTKGSVNKLRRDGNVPGIFYSKDTEPIPILLPASSIKPLVYTSETHLVNLNIDDAEVKKAILKNVQFDPVTDKVIHFDFLGISLDKEIEIEVPVVLSGQAKGVKDGGVIQHHMHKLHVSCLPGDIPEHITIDMTDLGIGGSIHVKDLKLERAKILNNENVIIVAVVVPRVVVEPTPTEVTGEKITEPEVIGKGKTTEEEEE